MAPTLGPILGGLFVTDLSWRWVFFVNLPIGIAAFLFGLLFLQEQPQPDAGRFDLPGFLLAGIGLASLMYGVSEGPSRGWGSAQILVTLLAGVVLLATMVVVELRTAEPMLHLRLFTNRLFRSINVAMSCVFAALMGILFLVALFFQDGLGLSALQSGLSTFPEALGVMTGAQLVSRGLYPRLGPRRLAVGGLLVIAVTLSCMSLVGAHDSLWWMRGLMYVTGLGVSAVLVPSQAAGFATISPAETGQASTLFNSVRQLGGAIGVALVATVVSAVGPTRVVGGLTVSHLSAYHWAFLAAAVLAIIGAGLALTIEDRDAAATFKGQPGWRQTKEPAEWAPSRTPAPSPAAGA
jgi:EmrB/QacA subfamily drug resistance transporter